MRGRVKSQDQALGPQSIASLLHSSSRPQGCPGGPWKYPHPTLPRTLISTGPSNFCSD